MTTPSSCCNGWRAFSNPVPLDTVQRGRGNWYSVASNGDGTVIAGMCYTGFQSYDEKIQVCRWDGTKWNYDPPINHPNLIADNGSIILSEDGNTILFEGYRPNTDLVQYTWNGAAWTQSQSFTLTGGGQDFTSDVWYSTTRMSYDGNVVVAGATTDTFVTGVGNTTYINVWRGGTQHILTIPPDWPHEWNYDWAIGVSGDGNRIFAQMNGSTIQNNGISPYGTYYYTGFNSTNVWLKYGAIRWFEWDGAQYVLQPNVLYVPESYALGNPHIWASLGGVGNISSNEDGTVIAASLMTTYIQREWFDGTSWKRVGPAYKGAVLVWTQNGGSWSWNLVLSPFIDHHTVGGENSEAFGYTASLDAAGNTMVCGFQYGQPIPIFEGSPPITLSRLLAHDHWELDAIQAFKTYPYPIFCDSGDPYITTISHDGNRVFRLVNTYPDSDSWNYSTPAIFCYERC